MLERQVTLKLVDYGKRIVVCTLQNTTSEKFMFLMKEISIKFKDIGNTKWDFEVRDKFNEQKHIVSGINTNGVLIETYKNEIVEFVKSNKEKFDIKHDEYLTNSIIDFGNDLFKPIVGEKMLNVKVKI